MIHINRIVLLSLLVISILSTGTFAQIGKVVDSFTGPHKKPAGLTFDGQYLWVSDLSSDRIYKLNPQNGEILSSIAAPGSDPTGLAWDGSYLWCIDRYVDKVFQLSSTNGSVMKEFYISTNSPRGITFGDSCLFYQESGDRKIFKLDTVSGQILDEFTSPSGANRGLTWDSHSFWSADRTLNEACQIDPVRKKVVNIIPLPGTYSYGLAWDGTYLWNACYETNRIYKIQVQSDEFYSHTNSRKFTVRYSVVTKNIGVSSMTLKSYFALPITTPFQDLISEISYKQQPNQFLEDNYDQAIGYYINSVTPGDSVLHQWEVDATTYDARFFYLSERVGNLNDIPTVIVNLYTTDQSRYEIKDQIITSAVSDAIGSETNYYWKVRNIHDYIIDHIEYNMDGKWDNAPQVLSQGHGSCSEYTMTFIAMCRASGIPACYEAGGHVRDELPYEDTIYHRWTYVYFPLIGWVPIDCTWDDRNYPANQARYFGGYSSDVFATTKNGGNSNYLSWSYNLYQSSSGGNRSTSKKMEFFPITTSVTDEENFVPSSHLLQVKNYPNPFNQETQIIISVTSKSEATIYIVNSLGRRIRSIFQGALFPGMDSFVWDGRDSKHQTLPSGIYFIVVATPDQQSSSPMLLVR
jgi:hypothetical protein